MIRFLERSLIVLLIAALYLYARMMSEQEVQAGPITLTHLEELEISLLPPEVPELKCEILTGDEKYYPKDPRPQIACYSNKRGIFFASFWNGERYQAFDFTFFPSLAYGKVFSTAADLKIRFVASDGSEAEVEFTVENSLYLKHCVQPLCLTV